MIARDKFKVGQRVRASATGLSRNIFVGRNRRVRGTTGTVVGFSLSSNLVRVHQDGLTSSRTYHVDFWEPDSPVPPQDVCENDTMAL